VVSVPGDMDESQISRWFRDWLLDARAREGHSQEKAAREADVGLGTIRATEQVQRLPEVVNFLRLIVRYEGEKALVNQIREWRRASGQVVEPPRDKGDPPTGATAKPVPAKIKAALGTTPPSAKKSRPKTG
jgi:hypothetical protein